MCDKKSLFVAQQARESILNMVYKSQCSHVSSALSCVDILSVLYGGIIKNNPVNPREAKRDRFILSKGHACTALYAVLSELGYFDKSNLDHYAENNGLLMSHVSSNVPGVEFSTGSLGHALPVATGIALALRNKKIDSKIYVLMSDGELNEGSNFEAIMMASQLSLNNLVAIIDCNKLQAMGKTETIINLEPLEEKFAAFGWNIFRIDGHNHKLLHDTISKTINHNNRKPSIIIADTVKGKGVSFMENKLEWHYRSPKEDEYFAAIKEIRGHL